MSDLISGGAFINTPPLVPSDIGPDRIGILRAAGFSDDAIGEWATKTRDMLSTAGFGGQEIDNYLGQQQRGLSAPFFDRLVQGSTEQPATHPSMLEEVYRGAMRSGTSLVYGVEDLANAIEKKLGQVTGSESIQQTAEADVAALQRRKEASAESYAAGVPTVGDVGGASDAGHYVLGKVGEIVPTIAEYLALGVPRMVVLGAIGGAMRAAEQNDGDAKATAAGAAIGAAAAGAPAPFMAGAVGKGLIENIGRGVAGMVAVNVAQTAVEPVPGALAGKGYQIPGVGQFAEAAASGAVAGGIFGGIGGLRQYQRNRTGEPTDAAIGPMPDAGDFRDAAAAVIGPQAAPVATPKLQRLYDEQGIHPAEVAHDAAGDVTISQDLASLNQPTPRAYVKPEAAREPLQLTPEMAAPDAPSAEPLRLTPEMAAPPEPLQLRPDISGTPEGLVPPQIRAFAPDDLHVDAQRFQYKSAAGPTGLTERLQGVTQWDPIKAGLALVFEDRDGQNWIADGHQRVGLAKRIAEADPAQAPSLNAWVMREADGYSEADARAAAAAKNIAEGTGSAVDAAKVLRDRPDLTTALPPRSDLVRQAQGLVNLDGDAFGKAVNGVVPPNYASIVGRLVPSDGRMQNALIDLLAKAQPDNVTQAESIVRSGIDAGLHTETQATLFGDQELVSSLYAERARILDTAMKQLRRDRNVFQSIVDNSAIIQDLGNTLAQDANQRRAAVDGHAAQILQTLANRRGTLSDFLTGRARSVADGERSSAAAAREFVGEIRRQAESGDLARGADGAGASPVAATREGGPDTGVTAERPTEQPAIPADEHPRDVSPAEEARANEQIAGALHPTTEQTDQGTQLVIPGAERSARQAMQAREDAGRGRATTDVPQQEPGGLFETPRPEEPSLPLNQPQRGTPPVGMALGAPPPRRTPAEQAILDHLSIGEATPGRRWSLDRIYTAALDRLFPMRRAEDNAGQKPIAAESGYKLARLYSGIAGVAEHWLKYGTTDFNLKNNGKPLMAIIEPFRDDVAGFDIYVTALHAVELEKHGIESGMDPAQAQQAVRDGFSKYSKGAAEYVQYSNRLLAYLRDSGVISKERYDNAVNKFEFYAPFNRVFGDVFDDIIPQTAAGVGKSLQPSNPMHEMVGSQRRVIEPLENTIRNTFLTLAAADKNRALTKMVDMMDAAGGPKIINRADRISLYRNGVREEHLVDADLAASVKALDEQSVNTFVRMLAKPASLLRAGATLTPEFIERNILRDLTSAFINTGKGIFSPWDTAKGLAGVWYKDQDFQDWLKSGGGNATMVSLDRNYMQQNLAKLTEDTGLGTRAWNVIRHPIEGLRAVSEAIEQSTRLGEFKGVLRKNLKEGMTQEQALREAAFSSREVTLDFARRGSQVQAMNMITAFFNAQLQGIDRIVRQIKDDPVGTSIKIGMGITAPSVLLWLHNHDDPRWKNIPAWQRDLFWIYITGDPNDPNAPIYRYPKPFETGVAFGSGVERLLDAYFDQKPDAFRGFASAVWGALMPSFVPTVALPIAEQFANRSTFTDRALVPQGAEKLLPEYEYSPYTTELSKAVGSIMGAFPGIREGRVNPDPVAGGVARALSNPVLIENYIRAWTGGLGTYILQIADKGLRSQGILPDPVYPADTLADIPFIKAFIVRYPSAGADPIQYFYDDYARRKMYIDTWKHMASQGDTDAMARIQDEAGTGMFTQLDQVQKVLGQHSKMVRDIYKNPQIPPDEKRQQIDTTYMRMIELATHGNEVMRQADAAAPQ